MLIAKLSRVWHYCMFLGSCLFFYKEPFSAFLQNIQKEAHRLLVHSSKDRWNKSQTLQIDGEMWREKSSWPRAPPHLSNRLLQLWLPVKLARWHLLMISLWMEATGFMQYCRGAYCVLRFSQMCQNSLDDNSLFSRTTIPNITLKKNF